MPARRRPGLRAAALVACAALVATALAGCGRSRVPADGPPLRTASGRPVVGDCWQVADAAAMRDWSWWQGDSPVDCVTAEHVAITVAVEDLADTVERPAPVDGTEELPEATADVIDETCDAALGSISGGDREGTRVTWFFYLPTWEQWQAGQRWLRCDVGVTAFGPTDGTDLAPLPASAEEVLDEALGAYRVCTDGPLMAEDEDYWDVYATSALVPCDEDADWTFGFAFDLERDEYPGEYLRTLARNYCDAHMVRSRGERDGWMAYFPSEESWATGSRTISCWLTSSAAQHEADR